jgi:hypothetical protein
MMSGSYAKLHFFLGYKAVGSGFSSSGVIRVVWTSKLAKGDREPRLFVFCLDLKESTFRFSCLNQDQFRIFKIGLLFQRRPLDLVSAMPGLRGINT